MNRLASLAVVLVGLSGSALAKDLAGVYEDAVRSDPVIRQADANRLAAREARPQAWSAVMPQIVGSASILRNHNSGYQDFVSQIPNPTNPSLPPSLVVLPGLSTIDTTTRGWAVNLRSNLFSWTYWMQIKAASAEVAQAEANYKAAEQDLLLRVATAYFQVLSAEAGVEANTAALDAITRQLDQADKRFEVGLIAITDVQDAKAGHDNAAAAVIAAKRSLATAQYRLQEITGQQYDHLSRPGSDMPLKGPEPVDESAWVEISLAQNLALISSRLAAEIARDNVRAAVGGHLPTLDLVAGRSYTNGQSDQNIDYMQFNGVNNKFNDRQVGLQFTLPIFSGGYTQSKVRESEYRWMAAKESVVASSRATERQSRDAYLGVISGVARVQALRQARESSQTALKATEAGYDVGTRTSVDVLNARRVLVQAETDYANSKYDYIVSVLQLRQAAGTLDRAQLLEVNAWLTVAAPTAPANATPQNVLPDVPPPQPTNPPVTAPQGPGTR